MFRRSKQPDFVDPNSTNNALHNALLSLDPEERSTKALELVETMSEEELNKKSGGNTPLMLALKTANFAVARAILERPDINLMVCHRLGTHKADDIEQSGYDYHQLTPLHLALAWRQNDLVKLIIKKYADASKCSGLVDNYKPTPEVLKIMLSMGDNNDINYMRPFLTYFNETRWPQISRKHLKERTLLDAYADSFNLEDIIKYAKKNNYMLDEELKNKPEIVESSGKLFSHCIMYAPELTDSLLFHTRLVCLNLELLEANSFGKDEMRSTDTYVKHLEIGLEPIISYRNNLIPDADITCMLTQDQKPAPEHFFDPLKAEEARPESKKPDSKI